MGITSKQTGKFRGMMRWKEIMMNDIGYCIIGALIILNMFGAKWYADQNKLENVIISCTVSIIITILMCCVVLEGWFDMEKLINYIRSCFCKHDLELIFDTYVYGLYGTPYEYSLYHMKTYRCKKCGMEKKYKSNSWKD